MINGITGNKIFIKVVNFFFFLIFHIGNELDNAF